MMRRLLRRFIRARPTRARKETNAWLRAHAPLIEGAVLSVGSGTDEDQEGGHYRDYFKDCSSYTTSDAVVEEGSDLVLDVRSMPGIKDGSFDCVFCSGVLEHVDDYQGSLKEITRILGRGGVLLLGPPFRQGLHNAPNDYWRFTEYGIRYLLEKDYEIVDLQPVDTSVPDFPAAYWVMARKKE